MTLSRSLKGLNPWRTESTNRTLTGTVEELTLHFNPTHRAVGWEQKDVLHLGQQCTETVWNFENQVSCRQCWWCCCKLTPPTHTYTPLTHVTACSSTVVSLIDQSLREKNGHRVCLVIHPYTIIVCTSYFSDLLSILFLSAGIVRIILLNLFWNITLKAIVCILF